MYAMCGQIHLLSVFLAMDRYLCLNLCRSPYASSWVCANQWQTASPEFHCSRLLPLVLFRWAKPSKTDQGHSFFWPLESLILTSILVRLPQSWMAQVGFATLLLAKHHGKIHHEIGNPQGCKFSHDGHSIFWGWIWLKSLWHFLTRANMLCECLFADSLSVFVLSTNFVMFPKIVTARVFHGMSENGKKKYNCTSQKNTWPHCVELI